MPESRLRWFASVALVMVAILAVPGPAAAGLAPAGHVLQLKVMTRNLYLGADLTPLFAAQSFGAFVQAVTSVYAKVVAADFPERANAIAAEVAAIEPDLVGLQEVSLWRSQTPADFNPSPNADHVEYDYIALLMEALEARGLHYAPVAVVTNFDGEAPRLTSTGFQDVRLTDRDALLARVDLPPDQLSVSNPQSGRFAAHLVAQTVGGPFLVQRGWVSADVAIRGRSVRVVSTHLEALHGGVNVAQGLELLAGAAAPTAPVVVLGDLNSAADGSTTATYANFVGTGFVDSWALKRPSQAGLTCCQQEDLRNTASTLSERIDFVLFAGDFHLRTTWIFGADPEDRTPSGLWRSDHAGVAAMLSLP